MPRFPLQAAGAAFLDEAPVRYVGTFEIPHPADAVWRDLVRDGSLSHCRILKGAEWTSPRPFGVGTTRVMRSWLSALVIDERYFRWEEGRRKSFTVESMNVPLYRRFAEDYLVEPTGDASCRFTWTLAAEPSPLGRPGAPLNALLTRSLFSDTRRYYGAA